MFRTTSEPWSVYATTSLLLSFEDAAEVVDVLRSTERDIPPLADCRNELVEAALARPGATFDGRDLHEGLARKAAVLLHAFSETQPCKQGNKRIGVAVVDAFLKINGWQLDADQDEYADMTLMMARHELGEPETTLDLMASWIEDRLRRRQ